MNTSGRNPCTRLRALLWAALLPALTLAASAYAAPFQNGSFEVNCCGGGNSNTNASGWTATNGPPIRFLSLEGATDGAFAAIFNPGSGVNGAVLSQTFDTLAGQFYTVTFDWGNVAANAVQRLRVGVRDTQTGDELITPGSGTATVGNGGSGVLIEQNTSIFVISDSTGSGLVNASAPNAEFSAFSFTFHAESAAATLSFTDQARLLPQFRRQPQRARPASHQPSAHLGRQRRLRDGSRCARFAEPGRDHD